MQLFRHRADALPVLIFVAWFISDVMVFFLAPSIWIAIVWAIIGIVPKFSTVCFNHHHQHVPTFKSTLANRVLEWVYAYQTGVPPLGWVLHHNLGHHRNYMDQANDESTWMRRNGTVMGVHEYSLYTTVMAYPNGVRGALRFPNHGKSLFVWLVITALPLVAAMIYNPMFAVVLFVIPMVVSLYLTTWHTWYHHAGLDTDDEYAASYNVLGSLYNIYTGNLGFHTAHHVRCSLHWSKLPEFHATIAHKIPAHLYRETLRPLRWFDRPRRPVPEPQNAK